MSQGFPVVKYLVSLDKATRDKAFASLAEFLSDEENRASLSPLEMAKLWKGLFYCFWMSDKPLVQQALAVDLAELLLQIPSPLPYYAGFWEALIREWSGIDRLRMDKYYLLVRKFINASFRFLRMKGWDEDLCVEYNVTMMGSGGPLCVENPRLPNSLAFHLADIFLEELRKALLTETEGPPAPINSLLEPYMDYTARTTNRIAFRRFRSSLWSPLLASLKDPSSNVLVTRLCPTCADVSKGATDSASLRDAFLKKFFEVASKEDTRDQNRRKMYGVWREETDGVDA